MYKIFGSLDFLGNLSSLVDSFSLGVHDLFYEPYNVLSNSNSNSIDFSIGILRGGKSFIKNTLSGVSNTVSRVTSSISKGVSLVSLDKDFNEKMNLSNNLIFYLDDELLFPDKLVFTNKYDRFVESCVSGVRGIVEKPMEGFKKGFRGFLVGVGKGIVGAVAKPVAGISDLACSVSEGVRDRVSGGEVVRIQVIGVGGYGMEIGEYGIGEYEIGEYEIGEYEGSKLEGVSDKGSKLEGVSDKGSKLEGVSDKGSRLEGVSDRDSRLEGVSDSTSRLEGVNNSTSNYHPVNNLSNNITDISNNPHNTNAILGLPAGFKVVERDTLYDLDRSKSYYIFNKYIKEGYFIDGCVGVIGLESIMVILIREGVVLSGKECFCMVEWKDVRIEGNSFYVGKVCVVVYKRGFISKMVVVKGDRRGDSRVYWVIEGYKGIYKGVNNSTIIIRVLIIVLINNRGVNNSTYKQQGVINSIDKQQGVNYSTNKQQGVNYSTSNYYPLNYLLLSPLLTDK
ncbi:vacuolar protein sorting-associated protein 13 [Hamiltosporidium tvaerminnensis]|uniref:Vacuolar protein sorting-associated protein 13 n=1 Tax=Hamiltosporidium tvaerminnensis TaxID=1176355 RepID=A0A4V2JW99_9MICR|nr:vacuolar protein sorting-associated protein 13 [Hamiltosporidium tvaerminnensis]